MKLWEASAECGKGDPGCVVAVRPDGISVGTGSGLLVLRRVQAPSKKQVAASELARARGVKVDDRLG